MRASSFRKDFYKLDVLVAAHALPAEEEGKAAEHEGPGAGFGDDGDDVVAAQSVADE